MDPVKLEGVSQDAVQDAVFRSLSLVRDYLGGKLLSARPAELKKGWRSESVRTPDGEFVFEEGRQVREFQTSAEPTLTLTVAYGDKQQPRGVPVSMKVKGKGFSFDLSFQSPTVRFEAE